MTPKPITIEKLNEKINLNINRSTDESYSPKDRMLYSGQLLILREWKADTILREEKHKQDILARQKYVLDKINGEIETICKNINDLMNDTEGQASTIEYDYALSVLKKLKSEFELSEGASKE